MKNKGFTLIELLGVLIVLGIIVLISFPPIINQMRNMRNKVSEATLSLLYSATTKYIEENKNTYPTKEDTTYCISLQTLVDAAIIAEPINDAQTGNEISLLKEVMVDIVSAGNITYSFVDANGCGYIDPSGAKAPELVDGMIPIIRDAGNTKWLKADPKTTWYSYGEKKWANAVLVTSATRTTYGQALAGTEILESNILMYYVWVPRFRYKLFNASFAAQTTKTIDIIFEGKRASDSNGVTNGSWLTHPAFTFGTNEVNGFWVAKFEAGYNGAVSAAGAQVATPDLNKMISKPSTYSWRSIALANINTVVQSATLNGNIYGLTANADSHIMLNIEWGATAYLAQSIYGKNAEVWINPNFNYLTGCAGTTVSNVSASICNAYSTTDGQQASTTGNVYGIYDMSGGNGDLVMATQYNSGTNTNLSVGSSGFAQVTLDGAGMSKYIDKYLYGTTFGDQTAYNRSKTGDSMGETRGWNGDTANVMTNVDNYMVRGGIHDYTTTAGLFSFTKTTGAAGDRLGFRPALIKQ